MTKQQLERFITENLADVELESRSATKFAPLTNGLAELLSVDPAKIGIKSLVDPKNFGNRISEATGGGIDLLILVAGSPVQKEAIRRSIEGRAVRLVPAILVVRTQSGWKIDSQFVPAGWPVPIADVEVVNIVRDPVTRNPESGRMIMDAILELRNVVDDEELNARLSSLTSNFPGLIVKRATGSKNLKNRIREASGQRPEQLLLVVSEDLVDSARDELEHSLGDADSATRVLLWRTGDLTLVEEVTFDSAETHTDAADVRVASRDGVREKTPETDMTMSQNLEYRQLERVKQLRRFLPFDANAENLFEEHLVGDQPLQYETKTLGYIRDLVARSKRSIVVLTGNAGHGKTHMCRRLLEHGSDPDTVMQRLHDDIEGQGRWEVQDASLPVRVVKDLSELEPPARAARILSELVGQTEAHVLVCANEGRLRDVVSRSPENLKPILDALDLGLESGETKPKSDPTIHVINLNFQAAVAGEAGFLRHVLAYFLDNQAAWNVCGRCRAKQECPILANREDLTLSPSAGTDNHNSRDALVDLIRIAEETGYVLTYRETLVLVAFLITGGLTCVEVERIHRNKNRWRRFARSRVLDLLFGVELSDDQYEVLRILPRIKRLDPGRVALRPIDEELHSELEIAGQLGAGVFGDDSAQLRTKRDLDREVEDYRALLRSARRRAWFESSIADEDRLGVLRSARLGLSHHQLFRSLQDQPGESEVVAILRKLVKGLHTIQGAINVDSKTSLHLVDPGFGRSGSHSAIIARSLRIKDLDLYPESRWWRKTHVEGTPPILDSVEWIDRRVLLVDQRNETVLLSLDLAAFEFVMNAADGIVMREFFAADRRRILTRLAHHAEMYHGGDTDEIRVLLERGDGTLTVERDGTILLERA